MFFKIQKKPQGHSVYLCSDLKQLAETNISKDESRWLQEQVKKGQKSLSLLNGDACSFFIFFDGEKHADKIAEQLRQLGAGLFQKYLAPAKVAEIALYDLSALNIQPAYFLAEGITLSSYQFLKYKSGQKDLKSALGQINFSPKSLTLKKLRQLQTITDAVGIARDLVNEPLSYLTAEQLAAEIVKIGKAGGFKVQTLSKARIEQLGMGGLLGVNRGSLLPPTFTIMEHKPLNPIRKNPVVLVGKGIVYDTGGLSLKPTANSMDRMKSDMSGAALVTAAMYVAGMLELPIHLIALVPATENRPGAQAYVPGDILKMSNGSSVEVLNTDAEGRLVLADALHYAKKYRPELVLDFATLTGSAAATLGDMGIICMGNITEEGKQAFMESGQRQHERLVELPLWEEYATLLQSDIADLKNVGGPKGGAITAGKFLEHFTDYPWMHFDIAGVSFHSGGKDYRPSGATGYGLRMLVDFLMHYCGIA
ncbi:MAG TPA: leucyl aminopeptidase [Edaphocola sp.]|nr:leucyl aminopeptidase [Edaphocola sp.]